MQLVVIKNDQMYLLEDDKIVAAGRIEIKKLDDLSPAFIFHDAVKLITRAGGEVIEP